MKPRAAIALTGAAALLSGCIAAAVPIAAGGAVARNELNKRNRAKQEARAGAVELQTERARETMRGLEGARPLPVTELPAGNAVRTDLTALPAPDGSLPGAPAVRAEAAAASIQGYQSLWSYAATRLAARKEGPGAPSVILTADATLEAPGFEPCGERPPAVIIDLDESPETMADPDARWLRWRGDGSDSLIAAPGAAETLAALRREGVTVIFSSYRAPDSAPAVTAVLDRLGLGPAEPGRTLFLRGGDNGESASDDATRRAIARNHCVIALVGDELGEFSDLFDTPATHGNAATETLVASLWGAGWFMLPSPIRAIAGTTPSPAASVPPLPASGVR